MATIINKPRPWLIVFLACWAVIPATLSATPANKGLKVVISPQPLAIDEHSHWVGSEKCQPCHQAIYQHWLGTPHARAYQILKAQQAERNPSCLRCHSTGYASKGGFQDMQKTPHLAGVQCEACHGPASNHLAKNPGWGRIKADCPDCQLWHVCMTCHTPKHSPSFDLNTYLNKIRHPN